MNFWRKNYRGEDDAVERGIEVRNFRKCRDFGGLLAMVTLARLDWVAEFWWRGREEQG